MEGRFDRQVVNGYYVAELATFVAGPTLVLPEVSCLGNGTMDAMFGVGGLVG